MGKILVPNYRVRYRHKKTSAEERELLQQFDQSTSTVADREEAYTPMAVNKEQLWRWSLPQSRRTFLNRFSHLLLGKKPEQPLFHLRVYRDAGAAFRPRTK